MASIPHGVSGGEILQLAEAVEQALDDMANGGTSVAPLTKAHLRVALEPFCKDWRPDMTLEMAQQIIAECEDARSYDAEMERQHGPDLLRER